ncbi:MAG: hypothetical protein V3S42_00755 [Candidatus Neomarinimicrobiota bacterium]
MKINKFYLQVILGIIFMFSTTIKADKRSYVWTYEYLTMEAGEVELEHYLTFSTPSSDSFKGVTTTEHNIEIEVGMTDRFDFSIYQVFKQLPESSFQYSGYKLRFRYRIGEKGNYLMDPLLYFEYKGKPDFSEHGYEGKLILAKDLGNINIAINPVLEYKYTNSEWESELKYNAGINYKLNCLLNIGLEARGSDNGHYIGPVISHGTSKAWAALGSAIAITDIKNNKPQLMLRLIIGIGL